MTKSVVVCLLVYFSLLFLLQSYFWFVQQQNEASRGKRKAQKQANGSATDDEGEVGGRALPLVNHEE